jgi:hypothetical protein
MFLMPITCQEENSNELSMNAFPTWQDAGYIINLWILALG